MAQSTQSLSFDGTDDYVSVSGATDAELGFGAGDFTVSLWLKCTLGSSTRGDAFNWKFGGADFGIICNRLVSSGIAVYNVGDIHEITRPADGTWFHFATVRSSGSITSYIDGVAVAGPTAASPSLAGGSLTIGINGSIALPYKGQLDDVAVWGSALSGAQIAGIAAGSTDVASLSPTGLWRFEEGTGTNTADGSGNSNDGTLSGGVSWSSDVPTPLAGGGGGSAMAAARYYQSLLGQEAMAL